MISYQLLNALRLSEVKQRRGGLGSDYINTGAQRLTAIRGKTRQAVKALSRSCPEAIVQAP
ncbi:hypothetical protein IQ238_03410 [Pleurocapsales cyanobacterium LEGE 06147]|nr:hypothetical protein [Pleurocapsales cyanobacterium LEGE 06147]